MWNDQSIPTNVYESVLSSSRYHEGRSESGLPVHIGKLALLHNCEKKLLVSYEGDDRVLYIITGVVLLVSDLNQPPLALGLECLYSPL